MAWDIGEEGAAGAMRGRIAGVGIRGLRAAIGLSLALASSPLARAEPEFVRSDANGDGAIDLGDPICTLVYLFGGGGGCAAPDCLDALDANDDGSIDLGDPIYGLNYIFAGGPRPAAPFPACGADGTADGIGCARFPACGAPTLTVRVPDGLRAYSIWSEGYDTVLARQEVLSVVEFRAGTYTLSSTGDTRDVGLVAALRFGPDLAQATPLDGGTFLCCGVGGLFPYRYRQGFETARGPLTIIMDYRPGDVREASLDGAVLDARIDAASAALLRAEGEALDPRRGSRTLFYSSFHEEAWRPIWTPVPFSLVMEDGTEIDLDLEHAVFTRGIAGETANRRLARARLVFRGRELEVEGYGPAVYAGLHHNASQEFRIVFPDPIEGVHGIDIVECPPPHPSPTFCFMPVGKSLAFYLDASLARTRAFGVTWLRGGRR